MLLLPQLAAARWPHLTFNEVQLASAARSHCFLAPQGGASVMTLYQPGFHVISDRTGKERCPASLATDPHGGTYWHYFAALPGAAGPSIVYNVAANHTRLAAALDVMTSTRVCEDPALL